MVLVVLAILVVLARLRFPEILRALCPLVVLAILVVLVCLRFPEILRALCPLGVLAVLVVLVVLASLSFPGTPWVLYHLAHPADQLGQVSAVCC